jgi:WD40 repeat protein
MKEKYLMIILNNFNSSKITKSLIILIIGLSVFSCNQLKKNIVPLEDQYFGLKPPGLIPEVFAPGIVSDSTWAEHCQVAISPDGDEIYWSAWTGAYKTEDGSKNTEQIFYSKYENGIWTKPGLAEFTKDNPHGLNGGPVFSPDGNKLFFYKVKSPWASSDMNTYYVEKIAGKWSNKPINIGQQYNTEDQDYSPIFTKKGIAYKNLWGKITKYTYENNNFTFIDSVTIHKDFRPVWNFYMSPKEEYVIFAAMHEGGYGDVDIYISFKTEDDNWGYPINMGPEINTELRERFPTVSPDGKYMFFMRHTPGQDFFWVSTDIIENLRKQSKGRQK